MLFWGLALLTPAALCAQEMVVSEYYNIQFETAEWSEFVVVQDNLNAVGYMISDANTGQNVRQGGPRLNDVPLWRNLRAGTIIVIWHRDLPVTVPIDSNAADGYLELSSLDTRFFTSILFPGGTTGMSIADAGDVMQIMRPDTSNVHMLCHAKPTGPIYDNAIGPKINFDSGAVGAGRSNRVTGRSLSAYSVGITKDSAVAGFNDSRGLPNRFDLARTFQGVPNINHWFWRETREPKWSSSPTITVVSRTAQKHVIDWTPLIDGNTSDQTTGYVVIRDTLNFASFPANGVRDGQMIVKGARIGTSVVLDVRPTSLGNRYTDSLNLVCGQSYTYRVYGYRYKQDDQLAVTDDTTARGRQYNETQFAQSPLVTKPNPAKPLIQASKTQFCFGDTVSITTTAVAERYEWTLNGGPLAIGGTTRVEVREPGAYRLTIISDGGCSATSDPIVLSTLPAQEVDVAPGGTQTICKTDSVVLSTQTDAPTYEWLRDGAVIAGASSRSYTARVPGDYQVRLASSSGCPGISAIVKVRNPDVRYRFVPTSLDFGVLGQCKSDTTVGVDLINDSPIAITITSARLPAGFALAFPAPGFVVAPGATQKVQILFTPSSSGISSGTVTFTAIPCDITATFSVKGERTQVSAALDRAQVDFGIYTACANTDIRPDSTFRVTNAGTSAITVRVPKVSPPFYLLTSFPSAGIDVPAGQSIPISIQYRPLGADRDRGVTQQIAFPFTSSTCSDTLRAQLQAASYRPRMTVDPDTIDVGLVLSCASTFDTVVSVTNPTPVPLTVTGITGAGFVFTGPSITIEPNTSRSISLGLLPGGTSGPFSIDGELVATPCGATSPIHAEGLIVAPSYSASSSLVNLGDVSVCGSITPVTRSLFVVASGLSGLRTRVNAVNIGGPFTTDLVVGSTFVDTLRFTITFLPNMAGVYSNSCIVDLGPCNSPVKIDLVGTGVSSGRTTTITGNNFGTVGPGQSTTQTVVITNTGGDTLDVSALEGIVAPFQIISSTPTLPRRLAPLETVNVIISYEFLGFNRRDTITIVSTTSGSCPDTTRFEVRGATTAPGVITGIVVVAPLGLVAAAGQTIDIPLSLESVQPLDGENFTQMSINVSYDPTMLRPLLIDQGASGAQGTISESSPGIARIDVTSATPLVASQPLVVVKVATYVSSRNTTPFRIDSVTMPGAVVTGRAGSVTIIANCMVSAELTAIGQPAALRIENILPASLEVIITTLTDEPSSIALYDLVGRVVLSPFEATLPIGTYRLSFDRSSLPSGSFLLVYRHGRIVRTVTVSLFR